MSTVWGMGLTVEGSRPKNLAIFQLQLFPLRSNKSLTLSLIKSLPANKLLKIKHTRLDDMPTQDLKRNAPPTPTKTQSNATATTAAAAAAASASASS